MKRYTNINDKYLIKAVEQELGWRLKNLENMSREYIEKTYDTNKEYMFTTINVFNYSRKAINDCIAYIDNKYKGKLFLYRTIGGLYFQFRPVTFFDKFSRIIFSSRKEI